MILGYPGFGEPPVDYAGWARGCGGFGVHVGKPGDLPGALREALAHPGPALVDVAVDRTSRRCPAR
jgi:pyruvate dehydrogenase (quinone)/pyruvate oxidase